MYTAKTSVGKVEIENIQSSSDLAELLILYGSTEKMNVHTSGYSKGYIDALNATKLTTQHPVHAIYKNGVEVWNKRNWS